MNLLEDAARLLRHNLVQSGEHRYTRPAPNTYEEQWLWDSCFHAMVYRHFDPEMAKAELRALLVHQDAAGPDAGMIPHMGYFRHNGTALWGRPDASTITQPPLVAEAVLALYETTGELAYVQEVLPALVRYYDWFARRRDPDGDGLVSLIHPWEGGCDSSPRWDHYAGVDPRDDEGLKRWRHGLVAQLNLHGHDVSAMEKDGLFAVEAVDFNAIYAANLDALAALLAAAGDPSKARTYRERAERTRLAINAKMWDQAAGFYWDLAGEAEEPIRCLTPAGLITLYGRVPDRARAERLVAHLTDPAEFWTAYPVPSVALSLPTYRPNAYWRGNVWPSVNWLVIRGLERYGYRAIAEEMVSRFIRLVESQGFREYFHPETGEGYGPHRQSWTALAAELAATRGRERSW